LIIDAHSHAFAERDLKVNKERMEQLDAHLPADDPNKWYVRGTGDLQGLVEGMDQAGVDRMVLLPVSGKKERSADLMRWSAQAAREHPQIIPFGIVHPDGEVEADLALALELGIKGIKLHPFIQRFVITSPPAQAMLARIAEAGLPVLTDTLFRQGLLAAKPHLEWVFGMFGFTGCEPAEIAQCAKAHPKLNIIAAHGGSLYGWDRLEPLMALDNVYFDISYLKGLLPEEKVVELIRTKGPERVIYGSDCPYRHPARYRQWFEELPLGPAEREMVAAGAISRLLGL